MWRTIAFSIANTLLSLSSYLAPIPGLELTPAAMVLIAQGGESVVLGAVLLTLTYMVPQPKRFAYIWLHLPSALLAGWLALHVENPYIPVLAYEALSFGVGLVTGALSGWYIAFLLINTGLNLSIIRFAT